MGYGALLDLLRRHGPATRRDLLALTGLSRSTLLERLDALAGLRLIRDGQRDPSATGRPPVKVAFDDRSRIVLALDIGASHATATLTDLSGRRLAGQELVLDLDDQPSKVLDVVINSARRLLADQQAPAELLGIGIGFPGLAGQTPGTIEAAAVLNQWDGVPIGPIIGDALGGPVVLSNDAHAIAYGEYLADGRRRTVLGVKVATGIGAGLIVHGRLHRGDSYGAGQLGHMRVPGLQRRCECGERGCLATVASGRALVRRLRDRRIRTVEGIVRAADEGNTDVLAALTDAGHAVGIVLSGVVTMLDPGAVLFGGMLGRATAFFDAAKENITGLSYARTARQVEITRSVLGERAAVAGLIALMVDTALEPAAVDQRVARYRTNNPRRPGNPPPDLDRAQPAT